MFINLRRISLAESRYEASGWDADITKSVYPALILGYTELSNFEINVKDEAAIGAFRV